MMQSDFVSVEDMLEQSAKVVAIEKDQVLAEIIRANSCNQCSARYGCTQRLINQTTRCRTSQVLVINPTHMSLQPQDIIVLGIPRSAFLIVSAWVYLVPLLLLITSAGAASLLGWPEGSVIVTALLALFLGFILLRWYSNQASQNQSFQPIILRKVSC